MRVPDIMFRNAEHVIQEVKDMNVKGGSPFGRATAWAYRLVCEQERFDSLDSLKARIDDVASQLKALKPTMATISNTEFLVNKLFGNAKEDSDVKDMSEKIVNLCTKIIEHSYMSIDALGEYGGNLISNGDIVMMHSYSSTLMSVFEHAAAAGKKFKVICTESRPLRESRLAAKVLSDIGVPVIYITDAEVWEFMPMANLIIAGADTVAWNGDVANKMGTAQISQLAIACKKRVYIATELYKLDIRTAEGYPICLEQRTPSEIASEDDFDEKPGIEVINQFFDITPAYQITGLITEYGVIAPSLVSLYWSRFENEVLL